MSLNGVLLLLVLNDANNIINDIEFKIPSTSNVNEISIIDKECYMALSLTSRKDYGLHRIGIGLVRGLPIYNFIIFFKELYTTTGTDVDVDTDISIIKKLITTWTTFANVSIKTAAKITIKESIQNLYKKFLIELPVVHVVPVVPVVSKTLYDDFPEYKELDYYTKTKLGSIGPIGPGFSEFTKKNFIDYYEKHHSELNKVYKIYYDFVTKSFSPNDVKIILDPEGNILSLSKKYDDKLLNKVQNFKELMHYYSEKDGFLYHIKDEHQTFDRAEYIIKAIKDGHINIENNHYKTDTTIPLDDINFIDYLTSIKTNLSKINLNIIRLINLIGISDDEEYNKQKYLKYKQKYLNLKQKF